MNRKVDIIEDLDGNKIVFIFALPVFDDMGNIERYNIFNVIIVVRHDSNGKMYIYDIINIKKETSTLFQP
ncbi:MAG: hypothetical protein IKT62_03845 [Firmicutes bacterium]|nr:hypothetical protein [Bacillota bacterium]